jgi:hypothetical protein
VGFWERQERARRSSRLGVDELANEVFHAGALHLEGEGWALRVAGRLVARAGGVPATVHQAANAALTGSLERMWRVGWQPVDLWQVFRRRMDENAAEFVVGAIAEESVRYAEAAVHPRWRAQWGELGAIAWWPPGRCYVAAYAEQHGLDDAVILLARVLEVLAHLRALPPQPMLLPPPGSPDLAGSAGSSVPGSRGAEASSSEVDPKVLAKVRALLAKAESTSFPEEADAFFAKAQELMSRYSLERAVVEALAANGETAPIRTAGRRIWLDNPYLNAKSMLVGVVAEANRCRAVFAADLGVVTVIGEETDTDIVEVLTTSLLVQAGRAMLAAGGRADRRGQSRTRSFRQAFLVSYAQRIGERLAEAAAGVTEAVGEEVGGGRLLPVLAARERAVAERVEELFPRLTTRRVSVSNSAGWTAGRAAADLAVLDVRRAVRG